LFLSIFGSITVYQNRNKNRQLLPYVIAVMLTVALFFSILLAFSRGSNPFAALPGGVVPANGKGLNPMLKNPGMIIHPLGTYLGYVGFTIPFAFALAALVTKRLGDFWIRSTRHWTVLAWWFLTIGNIAGGWWAYVTLGWGGYWAWDPVENASFLPWLVGTAFLHSVMIQEKKDMLKMWNMVLVLLTFCLTIFGTFLTRSGVVSSVHSFTQSGLGPFFVAFLLSVIAIVTVLVVWRRASARNLRRSFTTPLALGFVTGLVIFAAGWRNYYAVVCFSLAAFVLATIFMEFYRGTRARQALMGEGAPQALANLIGKNRRRYGGYVIHVGVVLVFIGVAASSAFRLEEQETIKKGDVVQVGAFALTYKDIHFTDGAHYSSMQAEIEVKKNGAFVETMYPEKRFYKKQQQPTTEVALRSTLLEDLYLVLGSYDEASGLMTMIVFVNPLVNWLWIGGIVMVLGTVIVMSPTAAEQRAMAAALAVEERGPEAALR
jgi:cytochrome c biogenesis factor